MSLPRTGLDSFVRMRLELVDDMGCEFYITWGWKKTFIHFKVSFTILSFVVPLGSFCACQCFVQAFNIVSMAVFSLGF